MQPLFRRNIVTVGNVIALDAASKMICVENSTAQEHAVLV